MPEPDTFQRALKAIRDWDGQSVHGLERLVSDAEDTFRGMPRSERTKYSFYDQVEVDILILGMFDDAGMMLPETYDMYQMPNHPDLAAVDVNGETLYFHEGHYSRLVKVGYPLELRETAGTP